MKNFQIALKNLNSNIRFYIIANGFYYAGYSIINVFLSALITSKILPNRLDAVGLVIGYYMFLRAVLEIPFSRFTKKLGFNSRKHLVSISYLIYGILIISLGHASSIAYIFLIQTLVAIIDSIAYPIKWTLFTKNLEREEELTWALEDISATLLPAFFAAIAGIISQKFGIASAFLLFGSLLILSGIFFNFLKPSISDK